jgi:hypothetical protein
VFPSTTVLCRGYEPDDRIEIDGVSNISEVPLEQLKRLSRWTMNHAEFVINLVTPQPTSSERSHGRFAVFVSGKRLFFPEEDSGVLPIYFPVTRTRSQSSIIH